MLYTLKLFTNFYKYKRKFNTNLKYCIKYCSTNVQNLKVVFFGTDNFSLPSLKNLYNESKLENSKISSIEIVTSFKSPSNPVRNFANEKQLKTFKWPIEPDLIKGNHLGIVVSFGHLIPNKIISIFPLGMINVHASLLPRWRGAAPIIYAIMNDDKTTGVTIMKVEPYHFDVGEILAQKEIPIKPNILLPELHDKLANEGAELLLDTVKKCPEILKNGIKQDKSLVTYAPKITSELAQINWNEMTANEIYNRYRALYSFQQLTTIWLDYTIKIIELNYKNNNVDNDLNNLNHILPGYVEYCKVNKCLKVFCKDRHYVSIQKIKVEGKKTMSARDFNNGYLKKCPKDQRFSK